MPTAPSGAPPGPDLLRDPVFTISPDGSGHPLTLPDLLARLLCGPEVEAFPHLAAEQRGHWWRFLVRCAARGLRELRLDVDAARGRGAEALSAGLAEALEKLAPGGWALHQPDPVRPGFLQCPSGEGTPETAGYRTESMALLTSAIGSKNHERKVEVGRELSAEQAAYALVEYQLGAVFGGRGNYGSQVMGSASGAGSGAPFMGARIGGSNVRSFRHDVAVLLEEWEEIRRGRGLRGAVWALWTEPWDGKGQLGSERLDPAFIPFARRVRLDAPEGGVFRTVWFRASDAARVRDHTGGGHLGDPFAPLVPDPKDRSESVYKVRGTLAKGYDYAEVVRLLFGAGKKGEASPSVRALADRHDAHSSDLSVVFEGTAYEQGKTLGFHRREVLLPIVGQIASAVFLQDPESVRDAHSEMFARVAEARSILRGAARILLSGSTKRREADDAKAEIPAAALERAVDAVYLPRLLEAAARLREGDDGWRAGWRATLTELAREAFRESLPAIPVAVSRRLQRECDAEAYLEWRLHQLREGAAVSTDHPDTEPAEAEDE